MGGLFSFVVAMDDWGEPADVKPPDAEMDDLLTNAVLAKWKNRTAAENEADADAGRKEADAEPAAEEADAEPAAKEADAEMEDVQTTALVDEEDIDDEEVD